MREECEAEGLLCEGILILSDGKVRDVVRDSIPHHGFI